ncbi:tyrosine-protein phosphatase PtbB [Luteimicrobium xylanilyticum]|uniref:Protein-tyrosine-phosphatase n=1 Tax=Luteimicrobium xylanilyticum TaxID=1133546 RepID=A0A5P9QAF1_9MICO|nr:tyrosine-protein phosphatase [Luteimicrobium xylanilyticum]QFU98339.1 Protein-tyrosine-phosphatase [Luteimicrobium xylanilyticum]
MEISGTWNVRDVGGRAAPRGSSVPLREGVLVRTASLSRLDDAGREALSSLGVTTVIDLRGVEEVERDGADAVGPGIDVLHRAMDPSAAMSAGEAGVPGSPSADTQALVGRLLGADRPADVARSMMHAVYASFVTDGVVRAAVGRALTDLARADGAAVVHCSAGKDRTGWLVALVQYLCGVDDDARLAEYLLSARSAEVMMARIPPIPGLGADALEPFVSVEDDYLLSAWDLAVREHGSVDAYVEACGLAPADRDALVARLV